MAPPFGIAGTRFREDERGKEQETQPFDRSADLPESDPLLSGGGHQEGLTGTTRSQRLLPSSVI
jgi:hypothetical protein